jgi:DNA primase
VSENKAEALYAVLCHYGCTNARPTGNFMASCIYHPDRTPSMSVDMRKGVANCHSCGQAGDAFSIVQNQEGLDFIGAKGFIEKLGVTVQTEDRDEFVGSRYGGRRAVTKKQPGIAGGGGWKPSWKR